VEVLCGQGRDVWVLDMRSSAGLDTATVDWTFETMAGQDIPVAIRHILSAIRTSENATVPEETKIDVVAHTAWELRCSAWRCWKTTI
jgi:cholesterol oxidase